MTQSQITTPRHYRQLTLEERGQIQALKQSGFTVTKLLSRFIVTNPPLAVNSNVARLNKSAARASTTSATLLKPALRSTTSTAPLVAQGRALISAQISTQSLRWCSKRGRESTVWIASCTLTSRLIRNDHAHRHPLSTGTSTKGFLRYAMVPYR